MAIASFLAGSLPLTFSLSPSRLRLISTIGMGVLVGTALIVIIPEGVETLYSASDYSAETHTRRSIVSRAPVIQKQLEGVHTLNLRQRSLRDVSPRPDLNFKRDDTPDTSIFNALPGPVVPDGIDKDEDAHPKHPKIPPTTPTGPGEVGIMGNDKAAADPSSAKSSSSSQPKRTPHAWIGLSLIFGFILMYLLDTLPFLTPPAPSRPQSSIYSLSDLSTSPPPTPASPQRSLSTTLGLCIHAAADGIALGASSSSTSTTSLSLIIFVAIMVHKAPAAFGLTSVLLKQGLGKRGARAHLVVFSLAAPAGAVGTWVIVRALGGGGSAEPALMKWWTGVLLLFSGGTFLYVAMHTMQEEDSPNAAQEESQSNGYLEAGSRQSRRPKEGRSPRLVLAAVGGMLLPLITQIGHAH
ncbi:hypothetical protein MMC28_006866 [Mycoblastus sanguinarius]|nr:hypothetical protein [Mycoblastus sanguinarius]